MYNSNTSDMHRLNYLLFLALSLVFLTGCGKDGRSSVYGTWTEVFPEHSVVQNLNMKMAIIRTIYKL